MSLIPWRNKSGDASRELATVGGLRSEVNRLFDSFFDEPFGAMINVPGAMGAWWPSIDISDSEKEVTVRAEIPGVDPKDLDISVAGNMLTLSGEKKECSEKKETNFYRSESCFGSFRRSVQLPEGADPKDIDAQYDNGVLLVHVKKSPEKQPKKVAVKVGNGAREAQATS